MLGRLGCVTKRLKPKANRHSWRFTDAAVLAYLDRANGQGTRRRMGDLRRSAGLGFGADFGAEVGVRGRP